MPDLDILFARAAPGWYRPARLAKGHAPSREIADAIVKCLARELRRANGMPRVAAFCEVLRRVAEGQIDVGTGFEQLQRLERVSGPTFHLRVSCEAARVVLCHIAQGRTADLDITREVVAAYCLGLVKNRLFGPIRAVLIGDRFEDAGAAQAWEEEVLLTMEGSLGRLVHSLVADPTAHKLRAPRRQVRRWSTAELLDKPLFEVIE